jgi:hypothetical protein
LPKNAVPQTIPPGLKGKKGAAFFRAGNSTRGFWRIRGIADQAMQGHQNNTPQSTRHYGFGMSVTSVIEGKRGSSDQGK